MADAVAVQPDARFLRRVLQSGGGDLKKCYQCATCSVACDLSPEDAPFPRRQMAEAQWGLKDRLVRDPAIWLCHNCGKCTERCPRGARPGDVLGALRSEAIRHFAFPRFLGPLVATPTVLPLLFLLPVLIFTAVLLWAPRAAGAGQYEFARVFPIAVLEPIFYAVCAFALLAFVMGVARFARGLRERAEDPRGLLPALAEIATNRRLATCDDPGMRTGHLLVMWGFAGLALVGAAAGIGTMTGLLHTPLPLASGLKIFANLSALAAFSGVVIVGVRRFRRPSTYFDWWFVSVLGGVVLTGIGSELLRLAHAEVMYAVYFTHLVLVFALLLYAPYSKFAHLAYRTVALATISKSQRVGLPHD